MNAPAICVATLERGRAPTVRRCRQAARDSCVSFDLIFNYGAPSAGEIFAMRKGVLFALIWLVLAALLFAPADAYASYQMKVLYSFCALANCADGTGAHGPLSMDAAGDLFGVSAVGGSAGSGAAFEMVANAQRTSWTFGVIHNFCAETGCPDGQNPFGSVAIDKAGNFYGTTYTKAKNNGGAVYMLSPGSGGQWTTQILYNFCSVEFPACPDGYNPNTGVTYPGKSKGELYDGLSPLFGTTIGGFNGVSFALKPGNRRWKETVISQFCQTDGCGYAPEGGLTANAKRIAYGTTWSGGNSVAGVVYQSVKRGTTWTYTPIYEFDDNHGAGPRGLLALSSAGDLFGTTTVGGVGEQSLGLLYELAPHGGNWQIDVLHQFCSESGCSDGYSPQSGPILDKAGNLFGTTEQGGSAGGGVVYEYVTATKTFEVVYGFCVQANCAAGYGPDQGLVVDSSGDIFGVTSAGGANGAGTVFELTPG